jgi:hypothetical protein
MGFSIGSSFGSTVLREVMLIQNKIQRSSAIRTSTLARRCIAMARFEQAVRMDFAIPVDLLREFEKTPRIVIRHPWIIGIPVPEILIKHDLLEKVEAAGYEVMLIPKDPIM